MTIAALAVASLVVLAYLFLAVIAIRRPLLTRIAYRQVVRRPWQSALMVAGMVFGSAAILAMATLTDWIEGMLNQTLLDSWGNVDLIVSNTGRPFSLDVASQLRADPSVAGRVAGVTGGQDLAGSVGDLDRSLSVSTVQLIGMDQATGEFLAMMTESRGASNAKAKQELGWQPRFASWRDGFRRGLRDCSV